MRDEQQFAPERRRQAPDSLLRVRARGDYADMPGIELIAELCDIDRHAVEQSLHTLGATPLGRASFSLKLSLVLIGDRRDQAFDQREDRRLDLRLARSQPLAQTGAILLQRCGATVHVTARRHRPQNLAVAG